LAVGRPSIHDPAISFSQTSRKYRKAIRS